jgi:hypothetical protein
MQQEEGEWKKGNSNASKGDQTCSSSTMGCRFAGKEEKEEDQSVDRPIHRYTDNSAAGG